ncbi:hypothetical protein ES703_28138 [subsurface metagenome]
MFSSARTRLTSVIGVCSKVVRGACEAGREFFFKTISVILLVQYDGLAWGPPWNIKQWEYNPLRRLAGFLQKTASSHTRATEDTSRKAFFANGGNEVCTVPGAGDNDYGMCVGFGDFFYKLCVVFTTMFEFKVITRRYFLPGQRLAELNCEKVGIVVSSRYKKKGLSPNV